MEVFCKIIESKKFGQFLVEKTTSDEDHPCVKMSFLITFGGDEIKATPEFKFTDKDESEAWAKVDNIFDSLDVGKCEDIAKELSEAWL